jgi:dihydrofolate reductase
MKIALIVAMDESRGIGKNNDLMWHLPDDMKFFKEMTSGQIVVMGRKNYDSIPERYRPLPNRENIILTRNTTFKAKDCKVFNELQEALNYYQHDDRTIFIIGGGEIYKLAIEAKKIDEMYITHVSGDFGADTFFPKVNLDEWNSSEISKHEQDEKHEVGFTIVKYSKKQ